MRGNLAGFSSALCLAPTDCPGPRSLTSLRGVFFLCLRVSGALGPAMLLPLHHLLVARDVSGIQQLVDGGVLREGDKWRSVSVP